MVRCMDIMGDCVPSIHPSSQPSLTDRLVGQTRLISGSIAASRRGELSTRHPQYETQLSPLPAIKNKKNTTKTISLVSLTDSGGGVDEIQDGGGE